jgi:hypothetical protein
MSNFEDIEVKIITLTEYLAHRKVLEKKTTLTKRIAISLKQ